MPIALATLQDTVGKSITDLCDNAFDSPAQNHCAHFVAHALDLQHGMLCGDMAFKTRRTGASIRCNELYNALARRGAWADRPALADGLLVFVVSARHVVDGVMQDVPQKHVGIHHGGRVFNFSNGQHKVVADATVDAFLAKFATSYAGGDIALYYGVPA